MSRSSSRLRVAALGAAVAASALALAGCAQGAPASTGDTAAGVDLSNGLQIVTTTTQVHDFATEITKGLDAAGTKVEITGLLEPGQSAHSFEPTAADLTAMSQADVIIASGLGLEPWIDQAIASSGFRGQRIDAAANFDPEKFEAEHHVEHAEATSAPAESADPAASESAEAGHDDHAGHDHGDEEGPNPHLWMAPEGARSMVETMSEGLAGADAQDAAAIRANADAYGAKLDELATWIRQNVDAIPEADRTIVSNHDALEYFNDEFGIEQIGSIIPSWDDSAEPSAKDLDELIANMKANDVKAIFCETQLSPAAADAIAQATGAKVYSGDDAIYTDALGEPGSDGATYLSAQIHNVQVFMEAWGAQATPAPADLAA